MPNAARARLNMAQLPTRDEKKDGVDNPVNPTELHGTPLRRMLGKNAPAVPLMRAGIGAVTVVDTNAVRCLRRRGALC